MSDVEALRQQAKQLLQSVRSGDSVVIERLRPLLPHLAALGDDAIREQVTLADVRQAIARKSGLKSWRALTRAVAQTDPLRVQAERFLKALRDEQTQAAFDLLTSHPAIATYSVHTAAATADAAALAALLDADAANATRATQPDGTEPIVYAVLSDLKTRLGVADSTRLEVVRRLLDAGASANTSVPLSDDSSRIPILYFPCVHNQPAIARLLLERGANPNDGESVYHAAQHDHRECLEVLVEFGADVSGRQEANGNTPLHFLAAHREQNPITPLATRGMLWLLEHGADPNVPSYVAASGQPVPGASETPLHRVAASGRPADVARMLIAHGALIDAPRGDGKSAYVLAVRTGNRSTADYLASLGATTTDLTDLDRLVGACALGDAASARDIVASQPSIVSTLTAEDRQALGLAISEGDEKKVSLMLELGWPLDDEGEWGGTPLHWAAWNGRVSLVAQLLRHGAPINTRDARYGSSPIAWAAHGSTNSGHARDDDYVAVVTMLLEAGATRAESYNQWNESPESMASAGVRRVMEARGFAV